MDNNTRIQNNGELAKELKKFSWAAFLWTFIWGLAHKQPITLIIIPMYFIPYFGWIFGLIILPIWFGTEGNRWAWQSKRWESLEQFKHIQKLWFIWYLIISAIFAVIAGITIGCLVLIGVSVFTGI